jgi:hypothetical protein
MELPICNTSNVLKEEPNFAMPHKLTELPSRDRLRTDILDPKEIESKTERPEPILTRP